MSNDSSCNYTLQFTDLISPICLPAAGDVAEADDLVTVLGWGKQSDSGAMSSNLKYVEVPVISDDQCEAVFGPQGDGTGCIEGPSTCNVRFVSILTRQSVMIINYYSG